MVKNIVPKGILIIFHLLIILRCSAPSSPSESTRNLIATLNGQKMTEFKLACIIPPNACIKCRKEYVSFFHNNKNILTNIVFIAQDKSFLGPISTNVLEDKELKMFDLPFPLCSVTIIQLDKVEKPPYCYDSTDTNILVKDLGSLDFNVINR